MTATDRDLEQLCQRTLGEHTLLARHATQRAGTQVLRVRDAHGAEFIAKRHLNDRKHRREVHAYTNWTPDLTSRTPRLIGADQQLPGIILTALPGNPAPILEGPRQAQLEVHRQAGELLRRFHSTAPGPPPPVPVATLTERLARWLPDAELLLAPDDLALVHHHTGALTTAETLPRVPCHLDYQPHNWLVDAAGLVRVIDFEHARLDVALRDFVRLEFRYWHGHPDLREAFLDGYGRPLNDTEVAALAACAALDAVTAIVRGHHIGDPVLTARGHATLHRLRGQRGAAKVSPSSTTRDPSRPATVRLSPLHLTRQLDDPDLVGQDLALFRTRVYRFSDDPRHYVLAEWVEERFLDGRLPSPVGLGYIRDCLTQLREDGHLPAFDPAVAAAEELDPAAEIAERQPHSYTRALPDPAPELVVVVVGAPRSGTSHLVNLLANQRLFAYFTTASCWAWPVRNLHQPNRRLFTTVGDAVLAVDNKRTRNIPGLVMPGEAEDIYARAVPVYRHLAGHRYRIHPARPGDLDILRGAVNAHLRYFHTSKFLTKSPFNSLRIPVLETIWGTSGRYIHIVRDQHGAAASLRRNRFEYLHEGRLLSPEETWTYFVSAVEQDAPADRLLTVTHRDLLADPEAVLQHILAWLGDPSKAAETSTRVPSITPPSSFHLRAE